MTATTIAPSTPVIIGVGQASERIGETDYAALSPMDLAARALSEALADCCARTPVAPHIDTLAAIRQFEISTPSARAPFGRADNPPRAIARRIGAEPSRAILEVVGGQGPQKPVGELAQDIHRGHARVAAIAGAEAISTMLDLLGRGETADWSETVGGEYEDRGFGMKGLLDRTLIAHGVTGAIPAYALMENARRQRLCRSLTEHRKAMARLFAPFTQVAADNPHAASSARLSADDLACVTDRNRIVAEPYTKGLIARDKVNQGAAMVIASAEAARDLGVPEERWVHVHAATDAKEASVMGRAELDRAPSAIVSARKALSLAGLTVGQVDHFDFYSCFPIPVANLIEALDVAPDDPRGLTLTGGLPFFGGAGNNYSAHAIAEAVVRCRARPGSRAMVVANGGFMSKYAVGIYSTAPADWEKDRVATLPDQPQAITVLDEHHGPARIESYTVQHTRGGPVGTVVARDAKERRLAAMPADGGALSMLEEGEPFGREITVVHREGRNLFLLGG